VKGADDNDPCPYAEFAADTAENDAYYAAMLHDGWALAEARPDAPSRKRKPNITTLIKRARKAGEAGEVRVVLPDGTTVISNAREHEHTTTGNGASEWDVL
jgi:hypothetical protein